MKKDSFVSKKSTRLIIVVAFFALSIGVRANPIVLQPPRFFVSELMFNSSGEWIIQIGSLPFNFYEGVDSVYITTSSGSAKWENFASYYDEPPVFYPEPPVITLQNDDLDSDLIIRQEGDFVHITTYYDASTWQENATCSLTFGDYPEATVRSPKDREVILHVPYITDVLIETSFDDYYCSTRFLHSSLYAIATISESNERKVCYGKIRATIHNPTNQPFSESIIQLQDERYYMFFDMKEQAEGVYEGDKVPACYYNFDKIRPWVSLCEFYEYQRHDFWRIKPVQFEMEQNSVVLLDLYIEGEANIQAVEKEENNVLKIYPNPIVENSFYYETALPVKSTNSVIEITGLNGQKLGTFSVVDNTGNIKLPSDILQGTYLVSLIVNQKKYATTKIIVP